MQTLQEINKIQSGSDNETPWHTVTGLLLMMRILERYLLLIIKQKKLNQCF